MEIVKPNDGLIVPKNAQPKPVPVTIEVKMWAIGLVSQKYSNSERVISEADDIVKYLLFDINPNTGKDKDK